MNGNTRVGEDAWNTVNKGLVSNIQRMPKKQWENQSKIKMGKTGDEVFHKEGNKVTKHMRNSKSH